MTCFICHNCGTQYPPAEAPPACCAICTDEREFTPPGGQAWTTLEALRATHHNAWREYEPGLLGIGTAPVFAIGQRALLVRTAAGNVLWDCIALIDGATVTLLRALGGVDAIAISHPHYYTTMLEWAAALDAPVWLHEADRGCVVRPGPALRFWSGDTHALLPGLTLIHAPGHFDGAAMLHWADGAEGRGVLLAADIVNVTHDRRHVSFMRSFPNMIPMRPATVRDIATRIAPLPFERIYSAWWERVIPEGAKQAVDRSLARYLEWTGG